VFETRGLVGKNKDFAPKVANEYYTTEGVIRGGKFYAKGSEQGESLKVDEELHVAPGGAFGSFLAAMRSRKPEDNNCDAEVAHYSAALCHLANISYRLGKPAGLSQAESTAAQQAEKEQQKLVKESLEQINANCKAVGVKIDGDAYTLGRALEFDPAKEQFVGADDANRLLTSPYRAPFVVPEKV
jgi:hypothetical protein